MAALTYISGVLSVDRNTIIQGEKELMALGEHPPMPAGRQRFTVVVRLNPKEYQKGIKTDKTKIDENRIRFHPTIPELNYRIVPQF